MADPVSRTTPNQIICSAIASVCSDGNSDPNRVALDIIRALESAGWGIVEVWTQEELNEGRRSALEQAKNIKWD